MARHNLQLDPQSYPRRHDTPSPPLVPAPRPRLQGMFRWEMVLVLLAILAAAWLVQHVPGPTFTWKDVSEMLHVSRRGEGRYTQMAVLGLVLIAVVYVVKVLRNR